MDSLGKLKKRYATVSIEESAAFIYKGLGGNKAGVTIDLNEDLDQIAMQSIAAAFGHSESAFVKKSDIANFRLLFFTPIKQVKMCGHATIAAWGLMFKNGVVKAGNYTQEVIDENGDSQVLNIEIDELGTVFTNLDLPKATESINREDLNKHLDYGVSNLPTQIVNTGFTDLMIPVSLEKFNEIDYSKVDEAVLLQIQKGLNVEGLHMFTLDQHGDELRIYAKNTDPVNGIYPNDDATGTSNGALASYLYFNKLLSRDQLENGIYVVQVGKEGKRSKVMIKLSFDESNQISEIKVGGEVN